MNFRKAIEPESPAYICNPRPVFVRIRFAVKMQASRKVLRNNQEPERTTRIVIPQKMTVRRKFGFLGAFWYISSDADLSIQDQAT
jgi:hypothetical protein